MTIDDQAVAWQEPTEIDGQFGFMAGRSSNYAYPPTAPAPYVVELPHQCDRWLISVNADKDKAITRVEAFIAEAQAALAHLRATE